MGDVRPAMVALVVDALPEYAAEAGVPVEVYAAQYAWATGTSRGAEEVHEAMKRIRAAAAEGTEVPRG